jgi:4-hydroxy-4-methyl-2-oxoglutarate aldolase
MMAKEAVLTIRKNIPRPDPELVTKLSGFPTGYFVDIQGRRGALDCGIKPMWDFAPVIGTAVTVRTVPDDNLAPYAALSVLKPGDVLVVSNQDWMGSSVCGDLIMGMFRNAGLVGFVTDGVVRDVVGLKEVGVPVYARGLSPNSPQKNGPGAINVPISIGGVTVNPGDLVVGDKDGVVVLSQAMFGQAVALVQGVKEKEAKIEADIRAGMTQPGWIKEYLASDKVGYVD